MRTGLRPNKSYRIFNTWMGDPHKMIMLKEFVSAVKEDHLLENAKVTGHYLYDGLL